MLYSGRRPCIKDGIGFQKGDNVKLNTPPKRLSNFVKGKAPMPQDNEGYILYPAGYPEHKIRRIHSRKSHSGPNHAFMYKGEISMYFLNNSQNFLTFNSFFIYLIPFSYKPEYQKNKYKDKDIVH